MFLHWRKKFEKHYATPAHPIIHTYVHTYLFSSIRNHSKPMTAGRPCNIRTTKIINRSTLTRLLTDCVCVCANVFAVILTTRHKQNKGQHDSKYVRSFFQKVYPSHIRQIFSQDFKMRPEPKGNLPNNRLSPRLWRFHRRTNCKVDNFSRPRRNDTIYINWEKSIVLHVLGLKISKSDYMLRPVCCPSVCLHGATRLPIDGF
jgi:hypothetical protein